MSVIKISHCSQNPVIHAQVIPTHLFKCDGLTLVTDSKE